MLELYIRLQSMFERSNMVERYSRPSPSVGMKHDAYYIVRSVCVLVCIMYKHILYIRYI